MHIYSRQYTIRVLITVLIICGLYTSAYSQFYPAKVYSIRDGMPTNAIYDITQSKYGIMWFMTAKGVVNYNSLKWRLFPDSLNLPSSPYSVIRSGKDGTIWAAGQNNSSFVIKYYKNERWHEIEIKELPQIKGRFSFDLEAKEGGYSILICTKNRAYHYDTRTKGLASTLISEQDNFLINAVVLNDGKGYLCTSEGLLILDGSLSLHPVNEFISGDKELLQLHWNGADLFLLGIGWLASFKNGDFNYLSTNTGIEKRSQFNKSNLTIDQFDRIFYSSTSAAKFFDRQSKSGKTLYVNGRVFNALSNKIYVDLENNVWVGDHRGLFKFNVLRFQNYNQNTDLAEDEVSAILEYGDEIILANARYLNFLKGGSIREKLEIGQGPETRVLDMVQHPSGQIYIAASRSGLLKYDGSNINKINWKRHSGETGVTSVETFHGDLFFSSNMAIYSLKGGNIKKEISISGLRNLQRINKDTIAAVSTSNGFFFYDPKRGDTTRFISSNKKYNNVYSVTYWKGSYYLATAGGLATIKNGKITPIYFDDKMSRVAIYSLLVSKNDRLMMGTNEGFFIWDGSVLINYNKSFGLVGDEVNRNAFVQSNNGKIWIGTEMGASVYNVDEDLSRTIRPKLHLENVITQLGTNINKAEQKLDYNDNTVQFDFLGISFFDEQQLTYRYKLIGFDKDWIYSNNPYTTSVRYTNLSAGDFEFIVEAGMASTNWSIPERIKFTITKPFYSKTWFIVIAIVLTLFLLYTIYQIRFYVILKNQKKLQREVLVRTREIQEKNEEIHIQHEELKKQSKEIFTTNEKLEEIVQKRTRQLRDQNAILSEYAFINSHELRAPICRMMGLLNLLLIAEKQEHIIIMQKIHQTGLELDQVSKDINGILDTVDLAGLEESKSIEVINALKNASQ